jgi:hypothetical protein
VKFVHLELEGEVSLKQLQCCYILLMPLETFFSFIPCVLDPWVLRSSGLSRWQSNCATISFSDKYSSDSNSHAPLAKIAHDKDFLFTSCFTAILSSTVETVAVLLVFNSIMLDQNHQMFVTTRLEPVISNTISFQSSNNLTLNPSSLTASSSCSLPSPAGTVGRPAKTPINRCLLSDVSFEIFWS